MARSTVPPPDVVAMLPVEASALFRADHTNVWLATGADGLVLRAHPTRDVNGSHDASKYRLSGLAALALAGVPEIGGDSVTPVENAVEWVHEVLRLLGDDVPVPSPMPLLSGKSFRRLGDVVWETLSLVPGAVVGEGVRPELRELGAFLAQYHMASEALSVRERPSTAPIGRLAAVADWSHAAATMQHPDGAQELRALIEKLDDDLDALGHDALPRCVLHGDPTAHNVLADGDPPRPCGLIDFDLAYHDPPAADIAFALWRSGRPSPGVPRIDVDRLRAFVAGYHSVRPLTDGERAGIPVYLRGRGLQMLAKRTRLRIADGGPREQVRWIEAHHDQLVRAVQEA